MFTADPPAGREESREFTLTIRGVDVGRKEAEDWEKMIARFLAAELECQVTVDYNVPF